MASYNPLTWFIPQAQAAESGGDPNARNPHSSATGLFGFTNGTWNGIAQTYPQLGLTPDGRTDPDQQKRAMQAITLNEYVPFWHSKGVQDPTGAQLYQTHFWGTPDLGKLIGTDPSTPLSQALGPQEFQRVFQANKTLFGGNPNITVGEAQAAVGRNFDPTAGGPPVSVPSKALPPGLADTPAAPDAPGAGSPTPDLLSPAALAQQQPGNTGTALGSNLLRLAAGLAGGKTLNESIGNAAGLLAQGMDNREQMDLRRQQLAQNSQSDALRNAIAMARLRAAQTQAQTGHTSQGALMVGDDGNSYQMIISNGKPTFYDVGTGQFVDKVPGGVRAQDAGLAASRKASAAAEDAIYQGASTAQQTIASADQMDQILPYVTPGGDWKSAVTRFVTDKLGLSGQAAQDRMTQLMNQQVMDRVVSQYSGHNLGQLDQGTFRVLQAAGSNWAQNPEAIRVYSGILRAEAQRRQDKAADYAKAKAAGGIGDVRAWAYQWDVQHPVSAYTSKVSIANLTGGQAPPAQAPAQAAPDAPAAAAPAQAAPTAPRKSLDDIFSG